MLKWGYLRICYYRIKFARLAGLFLLLFQIIYDILYMSRLKESDLMKRMYQVLLISSIMLWSVSLEYSPAVIDPSRHIHITNRQGLYLHRPV